jgi:hypothetical protein
MASIRHSLAWTSSVLGSESTVIGARHYRDCGFPDIPP